MRQIIKQRHLIHLLLIYTALEAFRHIGWMLFYEQLIDNTRQEINIGFIFYSGAIMITAYFADALIVSFVEYFTGTSKYFYASIFVGIVLCAIAVIMFIRSAKDNVQDAVELSEWIPSKYFIRIAFIILILYVLIAGMMDNLYFFDDWLELPYVGLYENVR